MSKQTKTAALIRFLADERAQSIVRAANGLWQVVYKTSDGTLDYNQAGENASDVNEMCQHLYETVFK